MTGVIFNNKSSTMIFIKRIIQKIGLYIITYMYFRFILWDKHLENFKIGIILLTNDKYLYFHEQRKIQRNKEKDIEIKREIKERGRGRAISREIGDIRI